MTKIQNTSDIGRAIRTRRRELGYTQAFLAEYAGVSTSFISELVNGKPTVQLDKVMYIISLLGMDLVIARRGE